MALLLDRFFQVPQKAVNTVKSVAAPIGGLNAFDSIVAMPESDALVLQNWWPQPYGCTVRKGYREWTTGMPAAVETLAAWADTSGAQKLFAWSGTAVYDITSSGIVGLPMVSGLTNAIWDTVNFVNTAGSHLIALNGFDDGIIYNAAAGGGRIILGTGGSINTWSGIDPKAAVSPIVHQHRLWVVEKGTCNGWFLPPDAVQGTFIRYNFGPLFSRGGFLQFLTTWTLDDGSGATDHLIAVSSRGEAAVYEGTDPEDDRSWRLTGVYFIGAPVAGRRAHCKAGGDQYILTQQGVVSMSSVLTSTRVNEHDDIVTSKKIQFLISEVTSQFSVLFGWDMKYFAKDNMLIINVPSVTTGGNIQLAANQITNAWTEFIGLDAVCWNAFGSTQFFGDYNGRVLVNWVGTSDNVKLDGTGGKGIVANAQQAYSYLGSQVTQKQVGMYRPTFVLSAPITVNSSILYDFSTQDLSTPNAAPKSYASLWNYGLWNSAIWSGGDAVQKRWIQAQGMGVATSLRMVTQTEAEVLWVSTEYSCIIGGGIL